MKQFLTTLVFVACCSVLSAQYKKASFFDKSGRTYGIGGQLFALGDGRSTAVGLNLSFGRDQDGKRLFSFWGFHFIPGWKFSYETEDFNADPITVSGKAKLHWILESNYGWYILKNEDEQVFKPFLTAGFNIVLLGGLKELDNEDLQGNTVKQVPRQNFSAGFGGGAGGIINFASNWQLKVQGGYTYQANVNTDVSDNSEAYNLLPSHPYANIGIRYRIVSE
jgi:hypothetical protein